MSHRLRFCHLVAASLAIFLDTYSVAYGATVREMSGTWLIAAEPHDLLIENGVIAAEYPVLVITEQGDFRAYRLGVNCGSDGTRNGLMPEIEKLAPCMQQLANSDADRLTGLAFPIGQGKLLSVDSGWRFQPNDRRPLTDAISNSNELNPRVNGVPQQYVIFTRLFDEPLQVFVREDEMELVGPSRHFGYRFVRVAPARLAGIASLLNVLGLSYGQYFRCALSNIEDINLLKEAQQIQTLSNQRDALYFRTLKEGSRQYLPDLQRLSANARTLNAELLKMPAPRASMVGKLGADIGCPSRDR